MAKHPSAKTARRRASKAPRKRVRAAASGIETKLAELKASLRDVSDLGAAASVLGWDQATYMPPGGATSRGRQLALLSRLSHERFTDPAIGRLLDWLEARAAALAPGSDAAALLAVTRRDYERALKVPAEFVTRAAEHATRSYTAWVSARPANDFAAMRSLLETTVEFSRELSGYLGNGSSLMDPLIDGAEPDMTAADVRALFGALRGDLVALAKAASAEPQPDDAFMRQRYPAEDQLAFGLCMAERFGYDLRRGRQDRTPHPFCTTFAVGDVRITTRVRENELSEALYSTLHETGHALYEQGCDIALDGTPLAGGTSAGVHESQSRLWENIVGRSRGFCTFAFPLLRKAFPRQLGKVAPENFYRAINRVQPSLIRTDADELTYNLHVMIRFDLECELLEGRLAVKDLPEAWRARYASDLGIEPPDDRDGCLQDVHWYGGQVGGGFQSYTIGNILSAQFYAAACAAHPDIPRRIERGEFAVLHGWLRDNIYRHGRKMKPAELVQHTTGRAMTTEPYVRYLKGKYGAMAAA